MKSLQAFTVPAVESSASADYHATAVKDHARVNGFLVIRRVAAFWTRCYLTCLWPLAQTPGLSCNNRLVMSQTNKPVSLLIQLLESDGQSIRLTWRRQKKQVSQTFARCIYRQRSAAIVTPSSRTWSLGLISPTPNWRDGPEDAQQQYQWMS